MKITRATVDTQKGPADWFTGDVYIDAVAAPASTSTFAAANVHCAESLVPDEFVALTEALAP